MWILSVLFHFIHAQTCSANGNSCMERTFIALKPDTLQVQSCAIITSPIITSFLAKTRNIFENWQNFERNKGFFYSIFSLKKDVICDWIFLSSPTAGDLRVTGTSWTSSFSASRSVLLFKTSKQKLIAKLRDPILSLNISKKDENWKCPIITSFLVEFADKKTT